MYSNFKSTWGAYKGEFGSIYEWTSEMDQYMTTMVSLSMIPIFGGFLELQLDGHTDKKSAGHTDERRTGHTDGRTLL